MSELPKEGHCQLCELSFGIDLECAVEATFAPHAAVRVVGAGPYCIGGPARTHVFAQAVVPAAGRAVLKAPGEPGVYKLFVRGGASARLVVEKGAEATVGVTRRGRRPSIASCRACRGGDRRESRRGGPARQNRAHGLARHLGDGARGQSARRLSPGVLERSPSDGTVLRVSKVALLFTDLTASTALYSRAGDALAYKLVHEHFELLERIVDAHHGAIVKTIGDAVMAAFPRELDGLSAAKQILQEFNAFRRERDLCGDVYLKLGFFAGQSFVVNANRALDYFGQTVNIAARLQARAEASEVVTDVRLADLAENQPALEGLVVTERFEALLKGLPAPLACARLRLASGDGDGRACSSAPAVRSPPDPDRAARFADLPRPPAAGGRGTTYGGFSAMAYGSCSPSCATPRFTTQRHADGSTSSSWGNPCDRTEIAPPRGVATHEEDIHGLRVAPGLCDAHVHAHRGRGRGRAGDARPPIDLSDLTTAGITTCVGLLGTDTTTRSMESLVARTVGLRDEGISAYCWTGGYEVRP